MLLRNVPLDVVLPNISPITPNQASVQTVNADLPPSWDFQDLRLLSLGITPAMIQEARLLLNGTPFIRIPGTILDAGVNQYFKAPAFGADAGAGASSMLILPLSRLGMRSGSVLGNDGKAVQSAYAKDLSYETSVNAGILSQAGQGIRSVRLELDLINTPNSTCSIQLLGRCLPQDPNRGGAGLVPRIDRQSITVSAGAQVNLAKNVLQFGDPGHALLFGVLLVPGAGTLDNFVLRYNGEQWMVNRTAANNAYIQSFENWRSPQAGYYWIDLTEAGFGDEVVSISDPGTDLQLQFTPSNNTNVDVYQYGAGFVS